MFASIPAQTFDGVNIPEFPFCPKGYKYPEIYTTTVTDNPMRMYSPNSAIGFHIPNGPTLNSTRVWHLFAWKPEEAVPDSIGYEVYSTLNSSGVMPDSPGLTPGYYGNGQSYQYNGLTVRYCFDYWSSGKVNTSPACYGYSYADGYNWENAVAKRVAWLMVYGGYTAGYSVTYELAGCVGVDNPTTIPVTTAIANFNFEANPGGYFDDSSVVVEGTDIQGEPLQYIFDPETGHLQIALIGSNITIYVQAYGDPYTPGGDTGDDDTPGEGGEGDFDDDTDPIPVPELPDETDVSASNSRFITLFAPTTSQLNNLADFMWSNSFDLDTFKKLFANPMDCILGLSTIPFTPTTTGSGTVTVGNISTGVSMTKCKQYKEIDCGTINVKKYWGAYLDYAPFTKAEIYLPFIGMRPLTVDDIMGKSVHVVYHVDVLSGACVAYIKCGNSVLYNFVGQCSQSIPVTSNDFTNVVNGALGIAGAIGSMVATGGASAPYAVGTLVSSAINALKPNIERSGGLSGGASMMEIKKPYIVLTRPKQALAKNQNKYMGLPTWITRKLSSVSGYTKVEHIKLDSTHATEEEQKEIIALLKEGVFL